MGMEVEILLRGHSCGSYCGTGARVQNSLEGTDGEIIQMWKLFGHGCEKDRGGPGMEIIGCTDINGGGEGAHIWKLFKDTDVVTIGGTIVKMKGGHRFGNYWGHGSGNCKGGTDMAVIGGGGTDEEFTGGHFWGNHIRDKDVKL